MASERRWYLTHPSEDLIQRGCVVRGENEHHYLKERQKRRSQGKERRKGRRGRRKGRRMWASRMPRAIYMHSVAEVGWARAL